MPYEYLESIAVAEEQVYTRLLKSHSQVLTLRHPSTGHARWDGERYYVTFARGVELRRKQVVNGADLQSMLDRAQGQEPVVTKSGEDPLTCVFRIFYRRIK